MNLNLQNKLKAVPQKNSRYILPNTLTVIGVCIGLSSIKFALDARFDLSIIAILIAAIIDALDGRIARLIKGTSKVGKELDSLTDVISFGVAPGFIIYFWTLNEIGKFGWMLVLIYTVCCALRLARFNLTKINEDETWKINFFEGVPSPAAAGLVLLPLIFSLSNIPDLISNSQIIKILNLNTIFQTESNKIISSVIILITSILMVSKVPTYSLKKIVIPRSLGSFLLLGIGTYISILIFFTFEILFLTGLVYIILIPVSYFHHKHLNKKSLKTPEEEIEDIL